MDERVLRTLLSRMADMQRDIFFHPPKTMEEFCERKDRFLELHEITQTALEANKGLEKD